MKSFFRNERGIALLLVLSAIAILTVAVVEFTYDTRIQYRIAVNNKERLQAYYLAKSGLNLSKVVLKYSKDAESMIEKAGEAGMSLKLEPLYRMMPLSSSLLRGMLTGESDGAPQEEVLPDEDSSAEPADSGMQAGVGFMDKEEAQKMMSLGADDYIVKTDTSMDDFMLKVKSVLKLD